MSAHNINILFLGGSKRVSIAEEFIKAGSGISRNVTIFSYELSPYGPIGTIGTVIPGLKWNDPEVLAHLKNSIREYKINIVVPFVDIATVFCSALAKEMSDVYFCVSDEEVCKILYDKRLSNDWFAANRFLIPSIEMRPPMVAKLTTGSGAKNMHFLLTNDSLNSFLEEKMAERYFLQELISGEEYSVDCYVGRDRKVVSVVPRKRLETINGEATRSITVRNDEVIEYAIKILHAGAFVGPVTIQFINEAHSGKLYLIEINPRLGSGVLTSIQAGANICHFILNDLLDTQNYFSGDWKENILMVRAFKEYYFHAVNY